MSFRDTLHDFYSVLRYRSGLMSKQELHNKLMPERERLLRSLPHQERNFFQSFFTTIDQMSTSKNFDSLITKTREFSSQLDYVIQKYPEDELGEAILEKQGYFQELPLSINVQGGNAFQFFLNPWGPYTYFADNHWAVTSAIRIICSEVRQQQWSILPIRKVNDVRHREVMSILRKFKIRELYERIIQHSLAYQQTVILPKKHMLDGLMEFEVLRMNRLSPIWDLSTERRVGWDYFINHTTRFLRRDQVIELFRPSLQHPDLGIPPVAPLAVDLEADLGSSTLNNKAISQAGMLGVIIATKDHPGLSSKANARLARRLEQEIQNAHSGFMNPHSVIVSNLVDQVHRISKAGDFDASFLKFRSEIIGKGVSTVYMLPLNSLNVSSKSEGVYEAKGGLSDKDRARINSTVADVSEPAINLLNEVILPKYLNIDDFKIVVTSRFWATTAEGALASKHAAATGVPFSGNEHRVYFYGAPPLPPDDPKGWEYIDNSSNRDPMATEPDEMLLTPQNPIPGLLVPINPDSLNPED